MFLIGRVHTADESPRRVRPIGPFLLSYSHFPEFLAYDTVLFKNPNEGIST
jgi:hypothetical protein